MASEVANEIEIIREVMGRPFDDSPRLPASGVSQFEVYFQAQTLFRKSNQLAQEYAGAQRVAAPPLPEGELGPSDTHAVVAAALEHIRLVKEALGIDMAIPAESRGSASGDRRFHDDSGYQPTAEPAARRADTAPGCLRSSDAGSGFTAPPYCHTKGSRTMCPMPCRLTLTSALPTFTGCC